MFMQYILFILIVLATILFIVKPNLRKKYLLPTIILLILVAWFTLLSFINPEEIVKQLGKTNAYIVALLLSILLGGSSFTAGPLYAILTSFLVGGANLFLLAIVAGSGGMVGDTLYYYFGNRSQKIISKKIRSYLDRVHTFLQKYPKYTPLAIFLYAAFAPLPNDLITISLGLGKYGYKKMFFPLLLGNMVFFYILLYSTTHAVHLILPLK